MSTCPECGAPLEPGKTCRDYLHEMLALEWQVPGGPGHRGHFLAVSSYNLQHPSLFTPTMLDGLRKTFDDFLHDRATIADARARAREGLDGPVRAARRPGDPPSTPEGWPTRWTMNIRDVCRAPVSLYLKQVEAWAAAVNASLTEVQHGE